MASSGSAPTLAKMLAQLVVPIDVADLSGRAQVRRLAAGRHQQHLIADVEIGQGVGDHQHHAAGVGELPQHGHHLQVQRGVQTRGRLVEDQQRRVR